MTSPSKVIGGDHEIAAVAFSVGYSSPSQFSREYRRVFGATPSQTALRATAALR